MEKNIKPNRADNRKKSPGLAGPMAAAAGVALGGAASVAAATTFWPETNLEGEEINEENNEVEIVDNPTPVHHDDTHVAVVEPEPFDPNEIMINVEDLDMQIEQINPDDIAGELASLEPITAESLMVDEDSLDIAIEEPQPIDDNAETLFSAEDPITMEDFNNEADTFMPTQDDDLFNSDFAGTDMMDLY